MGAIICQYQEQLKTGFLPLDDNFLVLIIFAAYSTFVSLCTHRRTMLKAPLREIYGKQKVNRHRKKSFSRLQKIRTFPTLLSVRKSRGKVVLRPAKKCPPCLKSTLLCYSLQWLNDCSNRGHVLSSSSTWLPFRLLPIFYSPERGKSIFSDNDI